MKEYIYRCDKCGKVIEGDVAAVRIGRMNRAKDEFVYTGSVFDEPLHFHPGCMPFKVTDTTELEAKIFEMAKDGDTAEEIAYDLGLDVAAVYEKIKFLE